MAFVPIAIEFVEFTFVIFDERPMAKPFCAYDFANVPIAAELSLNASA